MTLADSPLPPLNLKTKLGYGVGELSKEIPNAVLLFFLLFFLTNVAGLKPGLAGTVLLVGKAWDAVNDPLIGWLSDRTRSKWGRRFPWLLWGALPLGISFSLLWLTPDLATQGQRFWYYSGTLFLLYGALSAIAIPHSTLGAELTHTYDERTELISFKSAFSIGSSILGIYIAQRIFDMGFGGSQRYAVLGAVVGAIAVMCCFVCVWGTYERYWQVQKIRPQRAESVPAVPLWQQFRIAFGSRPFLCVMGIYFCSWVGLQVTAVTLKYYVTDYMELGSQHFTWMVLAIQGMALGMMAFWGLLGQRFGKRAIYCSGIPLTMVALVGLFGLQPDQVGLMYACGLLAGLGLSTAYLVPWAMLPDVMDLDELKTGQRREGIFCGVFVQLQKLGTALSLFMVGHVLDAANYLSSTSSETQIIQAKSALTAIRWLVGPMPAIVLAVGIAIAAFYPLTRHRHQEILLKLKAKRDH